MKAIAKILRIGRTASPTTKAERSLLSKQGADTKPPFRRKGPMIAVCQILRDVFRRRHALMTGIMMVLFLGLLGGCVSLSDAVSRGDLATVKSLLTSGANVNEADTDGSTPLLLAAYQGSAEVVKVLLAHGADPNRAAKNGSTPLFWAAKNGHIEVVKLLLAARADVNRVDTDGWTPLLEAAKQGHAEVAKVLLAAGADVDRADTDGWTPLLEAAKHGHAEVAKVLLAAGADVDRADTADTDGATPLFWAAKNGHIEVVKLLLAAGADVNRADTDGYTPLLLAAFLGHSEVVRILLANGAVPTAQDLSFAKGERATLIREALYAGSLPPTDPSHVYQVLFPQSSESKDNNVPEILVWSKKDPKSNMGIHGIRSSILKKTFNLDDSSFTAMDALIQWGLKQDYAHRFAEYTNNLPTLVKPTPPPTLVQGQYESSIAFRSRVSEAKKEYSLAVSDYNRSVISFNRKIKAAQERVRREVERDKPLIRRNAFLILFGPPHVVSTTYNPDTQVFTVTVKGENQPASEPASFSLALKDPVPNDQAPDFDRRLKEGSPSLTLKMASDKIVLLSGAVEVSGKEYAALPSEVHSYQLAQVDQEAMTSGQNLPKADEIRIPQFHVQGLKIEDNPVLKKEEQELETLREEKATQEEIAAMKERIARLKSSLGPASEASEILNSPVDTPKFHLRPDRKSYALVIGVEHYAPGIPPAEFADHDAKAVYSYFLALGIPSTHIRRLNDETATKSRIQAALTWLGRNTGPGSTVYIYYSGHGAPDSHGSAYLVPSDGDPSDLHDTGYALGRFYERLGSLKARRIVVALDACFTGQGKRSILGNGVRPLVTHLRSGDLPESGKIIVLTAAKSDQEAGVIRKEGHGLFTYYCPCQGWLKTLTFR